MSVDLLIERRLSLPPEACFALWVDPGEVQQWWGPKDDEGTPFRANVIAWVAREGATWAIDMTAPDGTIYRQRGEMIEVNPPSVLRFSFHWLEHGEPGPKTMICVHFEPDGEGTKMTFRQSGFVDEGVRDGHTEGWHECLDRLVNAAKRKEATAS